MKAKHLYRNFKKEVPDLRSQKKIREALSFVITQLWKDFTEVYKARNIKTGPALFKLIDEMNDKANSFRERLRSHYKQEVVVVNLFTEILREQAPEAYQAYLEYRKEVISKRMDQDVKALEEQEEEAARTLSAGNEQLKLVK